MDKNDSKNIEDIPEVISPISVFGPVEKFALLRRFPFQFEAHENYQKRSFRNRTHILSANGPLMLSVPLEKGKTNTPIRDVRISYDENWIRNHLQAIRSAYANAPYFDYYFQSVAKVYKKKHVFLLELFESSLELIQKHIPLKEVSFTGTYLKSYPRNIDLRKCDASRYIKTEPYIQVFGDKYGFSERLSILDLLFNLGPESVALLDRSQLLVNADNYE